jgi:hypothetical protein
MNCHPALPTPLSEQPSCQYADLLTFPRQEILSTMLSRSLAMHMFAGLRYYKLVLTAYGKHSPFLGDREISFESVNRADSLLWLPISAPQVSAVQSQQSMPPQANARVQIYVMKTASSKVHFDGSSQTHSYVTHSRSSVPSSALTVSL